MAAAAAATTVAAAATAGASTDDDRGRRGDATVRPCGQMAFLPPRPSPAVATVCGRKINKLTNK